MADAAERWMGQMETRMKTVEEGVANYREFQDVVTKFITRSDERAAFRAEEDVKKQEIDKRRARIHFALLGGLISIAVGVLLKLFDLAQTLHFSIW